MDCYACDQAATQRCAVCGNQYCLNHGDDVCSACLDPAKAAPSGTAFRVSVFALLGVSVFALWLLVRPPALPSQPSGVLQTEPTPISGPVTSGQTPTPSPQPTPSPTVTPIPSPTATPSPTPSPTATPSPTPSPTATPAPTPIAYTVVSGDTFYGIAGAFGVDAEELARANGLTLADFLRPGDVLVIPAVIPAASPGTAPTPVASPSSGGPVTYTVAEGNTIYGIADLFGVSPADLLAINGLNAGDLINIGDILLIPQ